MNIGYTRVTTARPHIPYIIGATRAIMCGGDFAEDVDRC